MLPGEKASPARFQISKIPWHGAVFVNQKNVSGPRQPVISQKIGARTVIKPREQPLLEIRCEVHRDCFAIPAIF